MPSPLENLRTGFAELRKVFTNKAAYCLHEHSGVCSRGLGDTQAALYHFGRAVNLHPTKSEKGSFKSYVFNYLGEIKNIPSLPPEDQKPAYQSAADQIQGLIPILPSSAYCLEDHLGICFMGLGQKQKALGHHENAILAHPNSGSGSDFPQYETHYLACVRTIAKSAILHRHGQARQQAIQDFVSVVDSTANVLSKYPDNRAVKHENRAAYAWLQQVPGAKINSE